MNGSNAAGKGNCCGTPSLPAPPPAWCAAAAVANSENCPTMSSHRAPEKAPPEGGKCPPSGCPPGPGGDDECGGAEAWGLKLNWKAGSAPAGKENPKWWCTRPSGPAIPGPPATPSAISRTHAGRSSSKCSKAKLQCQSEEASSQRASSEEDACAREGGFALGRAIACGTLRASHALASA
eukprot:929806-Prorocentrum_minimum.AAC.1